MTVMDSMVENKNNMNVMGTLNLIGNSTIIVDGNLRFYPTSQLIMNGENNLIQVNSCVILNGGLMVNHSILNIDSLYLFTTNCVTGSFVEVEFLQNETCISYDFQYYQNIFNINFDRSKCDSVIPYWAWIVLSFSLFGLMLAFVVSYFIMEYRRRKNKNYLGKFDVSP